MQTGIDILAFLEKIVLSNTRSYQSDFEYDKAKIQQAAQAQAPEDRTFYWMSRTCGTWCIKEYDVFLRESEGHHIWTYYAQEKTERIKAYRLVVTGLREGVPIGDVYPLGYQEQVQRIQRAALHTATVAIDFESGTSATFPYSEVKGNYSRMVARYGPIRKIQHLPENEEELRLTILIEHSHQKGNRPKKRNKALKIPNR